MGKTEINESGYKVFSTTKKPVHIWVAEEEHGKENVGGNEVHHLDQDKLNNKRENLIVLMKKDHYKIHTYEGQRRIMFDLIITFSIVSIIATGFYNLIGVPNRFSLIIMFMGLVLIFLIAVELRYCVVRKLFNRPNEQI